MAHQDRDTVTGRVRCKLFFPSKHATDSGMTNDKDTDAHTSASKGLEEGSPLKPMPDFSQTISSQSSSPNLTRPSVPSATSQVSLFTWQVYVSAKWILSYTMSDCSMVS